MSKRAPTKEEKQVLYNHLSSQHNIDRSAATILSHASFEEFPMLNGFFPFAVYECPHDYNIVFCVFCNTIVLLGLKFEQIDKEPRCPCIALVPEDISELTNGKHD